MCSKLQKHKYFKVMIAQGRRHITQAGGIDLMGLLIGPVQRLFKHCLLLRTLISYTSETHSDYNDLKQVIMQMDEFGKYIDKKVLQYKQSL